MRGYAASVPSLNLVEQGPGSTLIVMRGISTGYLRFDRSEIREMVGLYLDESLISAQLGDGAARLPDVRAILRFRHLLEKKDDLASDMRRAVNDELQVKGQIRKTGNQWYFGMKVQIGVDAKSGLVHSVVGTAANVHDVTEVCTVLQGKEGDAWVDAGHHGSHKRAAAEKPSWHVAMHPGLRRQLSPFIEQDAMAQQAQKIKAGIRSKMDHPLFVSTRQLGHTKVRYLALAKDTAQIVRLSALSNLWMERPPLAGARGRVRLQRQRQACGAANPRFLKRQRAAAMGDLSCDPRHDLQTTQTLHARRVQQNFLRGA